MRRWMFVAIVIAGVTLSGCSSSKPAVGASGSASSKASSSAASSAEKASPAETESASEPLDTSSCVEVTGANLDLATATDAEAARKAGDTLKKYDLPASVKDAVDHFVGTVGAQFDDPQFDKYNKTLEKWIKEVCPR